MIGVMPTYAIVNLQSELKTGKNSLEHFISKIRNERYISQKVLRVVSFLVPYTYVYIGLRIFINLVHCALVLIYEIDNKNFKSIMIK